MSFEIGVTTLGEATGGPSDRHDAVREAAHPGGDRTRGSGLIRRAWPCSASGSIRDALPAGARPGGDHHRTRPVHGVVSLSGYDLDDYADLFREKLGLMLVGSVQEIIDKLMNYFELYGATRAVSTRGSAACRRTSIWRPSSCSGPGWRR